MVWKGNPFKKARAEEIGCMTQSENEAFWRDYKLGRKQRTKSSSRNVTNQMDIQTKIMSNNAHRDYMNYIDSLQY